MQHTRVLIAPISHQPNMTKTPRPNTSAKPDTPILSAAPVLLAVADATVLLLPVVDVPAVPSLAVTVLNVERTLVVLVVGAAAVLLLGVAQNVDVVVLVRV